MTTVNDLSPEAIENLRTRFRNVIIKAGYRDEAPDRILAEWFGLYLQDIPKFVKMLESYENDLDGDPE